MKTTAKIKDNSHSSTMTTTDGQPAQGATMARQAKVIDPTKWAMIGIILGGLSAFTPFWVSVGFLIGGIICGVSSIILTIKQAN